MSYLVSIDPGVEGGYAIWNFFQKNAPPVYTGCWHPPTGLDWHSRIIVASNFLDELYRAHKEWSKIVCEWPFYHETEGGREVAASGSLVKLSVFVGCVFQFALDRSIECRFVEVAKWKGQMSKTAVQHRIRKRLGDEVCKNFRSHTWDAVGIGLYEQGRF